jgi:hypothetical protein
MRRAVVIALATAATLLAGSSALAERAPNLEVRVVSPRACASDMPCDPPIRRWTLVLRRVGAAPVRVRVGGPGTIWVRVPPGLYTASLRSASAGSVARTAAVRVPRLAHATVRLVLPAAA